MKTRTTRTSRRKPVSEPARLSQQDAALERAWLALQDSQAPSSAELERMRQRLSIVFESPAPQSGALLRLARGPAGKLLASVVVVASAIAVLRVPPPRAARDVSMPEQPLVAAAPRETSISAITSQVEQLPTPAPREVVHVPASEEAAHAATHNVKPRRTDVHTHAAPRVTEPTLARAAVEERTAVARALRAEMPTDAAPSVPGAVAATTRAASEPLVNAATPPLDEATLLEGARRLAASDPDASLRLLAEHKRRFRHGMLGPEREVLAIELLRSLSRKEEASVRLQEFRREYPGSVYSTRLRH